MSDTVEYNGITLTDINLGWHEKAVSSRHRTKTNTLTPVSQETQINVVVRAYIQLDDDATIEDYREALTDPGHSITVTSNSRELLDTDSGNDIVDNGPHILGFRSLQIVGSTWQIWWGFRVTVAKDSGDNNTITEFAYQIQNHLDKRMFTTRVCRGQIKVNLSKGQESDFYRSWVAARIPIPDGFERDRQNYAMSEDGRVLNFSIVDKQVFRHLPKGVYAGKVTHTVRMSASASYPLHRIEGSLLCSSQGSVEHLLRASWAIIDHYVGDALRSREGRFLETTFSESPYIGGLSFRVVFERYQEVKGPVSWVEMFQKLNIAIEPVAPSFHHDMGSEPKNMPLGFEGRGIGTELIRDIPHSDPRTVSPDRNSYNPHEAKYYGKVTIDDGRKTVSRTDGTNKTIQTQPPVVYLELGSNKIFMDHTGYTRIEKGKRVERTRFDDDSDSSSPTKTVVSTDADLLPDKGAIKAAGLRLIMKEGVEKNGVWTYNFTEEEVRDAFSDMDVNGNALNNLIRKVSPYLGKDLTRSEVKDLVKSFR